MENNNERKYQYGVYGGAPTKNYSFLNVSVNPEANRACMIPDKIMRRTSKRGSHND